MPGKTYRMLKKQEKAWAWNEKAKERALLKAEKDMNKREKEAFDRYITGNYGEDQFPEKKSEHRHTKGPWEYKEERLYSSPDVLYGMIVQMDLEEWIAECEIKKPFNNDPAFMETHRTNWKLMAAAPYMFDFFLRIFASMALKVAQGASKQAQAKFLEMAHIVNEINPKLHDSIIRSAETASGDKEGE